MWHTVLEVVAQCWLAPAKGCLKGIHLGIKAGCIAMLFAFPWVPSRATIPV